MKLPKTIILVVLFCFVAVECKNDAKKVPLSANVASTKKISLAVSGMSCQIGCAKLIESKLSKKEGVLAAKVVFKDSLATIEFDSNKTSKADLISFIDGIGGGELYRSLEAPKKTDTCKESCKKECCASKKNEKKECNATCKKDCCQGKEG